MVREFSDTKECRRLASIEAYEKGESCAGGRQPRLANSPHLYSYARKMTVVILSLFNNLYSNSIERH